MKPLKVPTAKKVATVSIDCQELTNSPYMSQGKIWSDSHYKWGQKNVYDIFFYSLMARSRSDPAPKAES
jgi:hypothetical protein